MRRQIEWAANDAGSQQITDERFAAMTVPCPECGAAVLYSSAHLYGGRNPGWRCPDADEAGDDRG